MKRNTIWGLLLCLNALFLLINGSIAIQLGESWLLYAFAAVCSLIGAAQCIDMLRSK